MKRVRNPDSIGGVFTMPLLRSFMPDVFGDSGRSPPAVACSRSLRAAFCACFLMSFLSRAVCRWGPLAGTGAGEDAFCELNLSLMVGLGRVSGTSSPFLSGCEVRDTEASDLTDSKELLWVSNLALQTAVVTRVYGPASCLGRPCLGIPHRYQVHAQR
jgi:hypothetical protein